MRVRGWQLVACDEPHAAAQMAFDVELARRQVPTLRLFQWTRPALSLGYRQPAPAWLDPEALAAAGVETVERPTGGGLAIHGSDLSLSVVAPIAQAPSIRELMGMVCGAVAAALGGLGVSAQAQTEAAAGSRIEWCLAEASPYAVLAEGRKLCGFASRRLPGAWLVQGSLLVRPIPQVFERALPASVRAALAERAVALQQLTGRKLFDDELRAAIARAWRAATGVPCEWNEDWPRREAAEWLSQGDVLAAKWWRRTYEPRPQSPEREQVAG
jgi:lipoate-protein ligase A